MKFYPYKMGGGAEKVLAMLKGGLKGGTKSFSDIVGGGGGYPLQGGGGHVKLNPVLRGGRKKFRTHNFSIL